jgi:hypothetical protein
MLTANPDFRAIRRQAWKKIIFLSLWILLCATLLIAGLVWTRQALP